MTGGRANVTDLRDGLLNSVNRRTVFSSAPQDKGTIDDWASRYLVWMALGGTRQTIPQSILSVIATTQILGIPRPFASVPVDANMLSSAKDLCSSVLPDSISLEAIEPVVRSSLSSTTPNPFSFEAGMFGGGKPQQTTLVYSNGDAMLWGKVCSVDNPPPVRALTVPSPSIWSSNPNPWNFMKVREEFDFYDSSVFPALSKVVDQRGNVVTGITSDNYFPWCIRPPLDNPEAPENSTNPLAVAFNTWRNAHPALDGNELPYCPGKDSTGARYITSQWLGDPSLSKDKLNQWITRGAVNAGLMVYSYLNQVSNAGIAPTPAFDQCNGLTP